MKTGLRRLIYAGIGYALTPLLVTRLLLRSRQQPGYRRHLSQRFGHGSDLRSAARRIHFHCVSVGEALAAIPLIESLSARHPHLVLSVSVTTPTGRERLEHQFSDRFDISYLPFDTPRAVARFLDRLATDALVLVETELWPNLIYQCGLRRIPVLVVNGRMSARSHHRYARQAWLTRSMFASLKGVMAQFPADVERFIALGCDPQRVVQVGNLKFDIALQDDERQRAAALVDEWQLQHRPVWIAASTHPGEEELVLAAHEKLLASHTDALLILVPRHPARCAAVGALIQNKALRWVARSAVAGRLDEQQVLLVDTLGELLVLYGLADVAFVGGSLVPRGGHNPIEAALWQLPILSGPNTFNFTEVFEQFARDGAMAWVQDDTQLAARLESLISDSATAAEMGRRGGAVVQMNRGSLQAQLSGLEEMTGLPQGEPVHVGARG